MKNILFFFTGFILTGTNTNFCLEYDKINCSVTYDSLKRRLADCISVSKNSTLQLPNNIPKDIQHLCINAYHCEIAIPSEDTFRRYPSLQILEMNVKRLRFNETLLLPENLKRLTSELFNLPSLHTLLILYYKESAGETRINRSFVLPSTLTKFRVLNSAFEYTINACSKLEELNLTNAGLSKLPEFPDPMDSLVLLDLRGNPLNELKVEELARLCRLRHLAIHDDLMDVCECRRLTQWIDKLRKWDHFTFVGDLNCSTSADKQCMDSTFDEAVSLRRSCEYGNLWGMVKWIMVALVVIVTIFIALYLFLYRHPQPVEEL